MRYPVLTLLLGVCLGRPFSPIPRLHRPPPSSLRDNNNPGSGNCSELFFTQAIDHFSSVPPPLGETTYQQRYFLNTDSYDSSSPETATLFFYFGNEADVTLYINATGLMWENAADFNAVLLFAEHRYYGVSQPFGSQLDTSDMSMMRYLSVEQALEDYAVLVDSVRSDLGLPDSDVGLSG